MSRIKEVPMFRTPENWKELHDWIEAHSPSERAHITTGAMMAWNLAAKITNEGVYGDD